MIPTGPAIGEYDCKKAVINEMVRTKTIEGDPVITPTLFIKRYPKFRSQNSGRELQEGGQTLSVTALYIRFRRDSATLLIDPSMQIVHRGVTYGILAPNPIDYGTGELEFLCQAINPVT